MLTAYGTKVQWWKLGSTINYVIILRQNYWFNYRPYSNLTSFSSNVLFLFQDSIQNPTWHLVFEFPWFSFWDNSSVFYDVWGALVRSYMECLLIWICLTFSHDWIEVMQFGAQTPQKWCCAFLDASYRGYVMLMWHLLVERSLIYFPHDKLLGIWKELSSPWASPP